MRAELSSGIDLVFVNGTQVGENILELDIQATQSEVLTASLIGGDRVAYIFDVGAGAGPNGGGPLFMTSAGPTQAGDVFNVGKNETSKTGIPMVGSNKLVSIRISNYTVITGTKARVQLRRRTGEQTWELISGAIVEIPVGQYEAVSLYDLTLPDDPELGAIVLNDSGNLNEAILVIQLKYLGPSST